jgi:sulfonate transport system substrate-binding protein
MTRITRRSLVGGALATAGAAAALPAPAAERPVLRVGNQKGGLRSLLEASGVAQSLPYTLEWAEFPAAAPLLEALNAGALDLGYQGDLAFLTSFAAGAPLRIIGAARPSSAAQAILVDQDSPIRSVADLRGRRVAGNRGGWGQYLIRSALKQAGVAPGEVDITLLPPADASLAFRSGAVDAWAVWDPYVALEVQQFGARVLVDGRGLTPAIMLVSAHESAIRTKRPQLADFLARFRAGWAWADGHIPDYARYNAALTGLPEPVLRRTYETERTMPVALTPALMDELQEAAANALEFRLLRQPLDVRRAFDRTLDAAGAA